MSSVNQTFTKMYLSQRNPTRPNTTSPQGHSIASTSGQLQQQPQQWGRIGRGSVSSGSAMGTTTPMSQHRPSLLEEGGPLGGDQFDEFDKLPSALGGVTSRSNFLDDEEEDDENNSSNVVESIGSPQGALPGKRGSMQFTESRGSRGTRNSSNSNDNETVDLFAHGLHFFGAEDGGNAEEDEDEDAEFVTRTIGEKAMSQFSLVSATSGVVSRQSLTPSSKPVGVPQYHHQPKQPGGKRNSQAVPSNKKARNSEAGEMASMVSLHSNAHLSRKQSTAANSAAAEVRRKQVKDRRAQLNQSFRREREQNLEGSRIRLEIAAERKVVMSLQMTTQRHWAWAALCHMSFFATTLVTASRAATDRQRRNTLLLPMVHILARRWLRYTRMKRLQSTVKKPLLTEIRLDRTLGLFSDAHLGYLLTHLTLRYYFENETIIFMGCEDDECFVLASGAVDVIVGHTVVSRLTAAGVVFGSVGMISGEPRTASIIARTPTLVWVCTRAKFEEFGMTDNRVQDALAIIADLRQNNLRAVYKRYISANYLGTFSPMKDLSSSTIDALLMQAAPLVTKAGVRILQPYSVTNVATHRCFFLLRGSIKIIFSSALNAHGAPMLPVAPGSSSASSSSKSAQSTSISTTLREYVQRLVQFPLRGARVTFAEEAAKESVHPALVPLDVPSAVSSLSDGSAVVTLKGPLIMNMYSLIVNDALPFSVETVGGCDMLYVTRQQLMALDPVEIDNVRRRCVDLHREFLLPLPPRGLRMAICRGALSAAAHSYLKGLDVKKLHVRPPEQESAVLCPGDTLLFDPEHGMVAYIIIRGQLQGVTAPPNGEPYLWPDLHLVYFGSVNAKATALTQMDVLRVQRRDIVDWLVTQLVTKDMELYVAAMSQAFELALHRKPHFSFESIDSPRDGAEGAKSSSPFRVSRRRSMLALHRTNNFTVSSDTVEQTRASQNRSINAALVYQEATSGRQALLRKRTSNRLNKMKPIENEGDEDKAGGSDDHAEEGPATPMKVDSVVGGGSRSTASSFHRNGSVLDGGRQHAFTTFGLTMTASAATLVRGEGSPRSQSPFSSMDGYQDYNALDDADDSEGDDDFVRVGPQPTNAVAALPVGQGGESPASPVPGMQGKRGTLWMSTSASTAPIPLPNMPSAPLHTPVNFMGTEQSAQPPTTAIIGVHPRAGFYTGSQVSGEGFSQSGQRPQINLRSLEEFELSEEATPLGQHDAFGAGKQHNAMHPGSSGVLGVSHGQIVVNRKNPSSHPPGGSMRLHEFAERSTFGASTTMHSSQRSPVHNHRNADATSSAFSRVSPMTSTNDKDTSTSEHPCARSLTNNNSFSPRSPQGLPPPHTSPRLAHQPHSPSGAHAVMSPQKGTPLGPLPGASTSLRSHPARMSHSIHAASTMVLPSALREAHNSSPPVTPPMRPLGGSARKHSPRPPSPNYTHSRRPTQRPAVSSSLSPKAPSRLHLGTASTTTPSKSPLRPSTASAFPQLSDSVPSNALSSSGAPRPQQQRNASSSTTPQSPRMAQSANLGALLTSIRTSTATESGVTQRHNLNSSAPNVAATLDKWFGNNGSKARGEGGDDEEHVRFLPTQHPKPKNETVAERRKQILRGSRKR